MTWRDEPLTRGVTYDAIMNATKRVRKGEKGMKESAKAFGLGSPMKYAYRAIETSLYALASFGEEIAAELKGPQRYTYLEAWESPYGGFYESHLPNSEALAVDLAINNPSRFYMAIEMED